MQVAFIFIFHVAVVSKNKYGFPRVPLALHLAAQHLLSKHIASAYLKHTYFHSECPSSSPRCYETVAFHEEFSDPSYVNQLLIDSQSKQFAPYPTLGPSGCPFPPPHPQTVSKNNRGTFLNSPSKPDIFEISSS